MVGEADLRGDLRFKRPDGRITRWFEANKNQSCRSREFAGAYLFQLPLILPTFPTKK